jgi:hypothetical protein
VHDHDTVFADYHRARTRRIVAAVAGWVLAAALCVSGVVAIGAVTAHPASATSLASSSTSSSTTEATIPVDVAAVVNSTLAPAPPPAPTPTPSLRPALTPTRAPTSTIARQTAYAIAIAVTGYQIELNACQWVRMNLADTLPIVGAHTHCGGILVLRLQLGDTVTLSGQGLDGTYRVADALDAKAGDNSASATAGMTATVILQSCYLGGGGRVRLVGLIPEAS